MSRAVNTQLRDGLKIEYAGHEHRFYRVDVEDTQDPDTTGSMVYYEIVRDDGEWMGRVTQYIRQDRVTALIRRRYEPETERIHTFQFGGQLIMSRKKRKGKKPGEVPPVWYIAIPRHYVQRFDIRVDDEIQVHIGDTKPDGPIDELYHVSMQGKTCVVVLSKLWRMTGRNGDGPEDKGRSPGTSGAPEDPETEGETSPYTFHDKEYRTVEIKPHRSPSGNWNLCYWYDRVRADKKNRYRIRSESWDVKKRRPKDRTAEDPDGEDGPLKEPETNFNDW